MFKEIRTVNEKKGIVRITTSDERFYALPSINKETGLPEYRFVPSCTWICSFYPKGKAFWHWLANQGWDEAEAIKQAAGNKGSKVHQAITRYLNGEVIKIDAKFLNPDNDKEEDLNTEEYECLVSFHDWFKSFDKRPEVIANEITVFNDKENYAGTVDLLCKIDNEIWLIDFKTGQSVWPEYELQLSAYKHADLEITVERMGILQLGYKRNGNRYKFTEIDDKFELFKAAQLIWSNENSDSKPRQKDYPLEISLPKVQEKKVKKAK